MFAHSRLAVAWVGVPARRSLRATLWYLATERRLSRHSTDGQSSPSQRSDLSVCMPASCQNEFLPHSLTDASPSPKPTTRHVTRQLAVTKTYMKPTNINGFPWIFTRHSCTGRYTAVARISYGDSVCLSVWGVTIRCRTKNRWVRDSGSSPYDSLESLVSNEVILVPLREEIPLERGHQRGVPP